MTSRILFLTIGVLALLHTSIFAQKTTTRNLSAFDNISIAGGFDKVYLKAGSSETVSIEAEGIDPDKILTEVDGNTLKVHMKKGSYRNSKIKLNITYKSLREINNSGSSDIEALSAISGDTFTFKSSGSGDFIGALDVKKLDIKISGSSDMKLRGKADKQSYSISGSGDVKASELSGSEADVAISGSGDVSLHVSGPVRTAVSGSGDVSNN